LIAHDVHHDAAVLRVAILCSARITIGALHGAVLAVAIVVANVGSARVLVITFVVAVARVGNRNVLATARIRLIAIAKQAQIGSALITIGARLLHGHDWVVGVVGNDALAERCVGSSAQIERRALVWRW
jgi:hypothetical protein